MVEIEVAVDVGGSVTVAVKHAQILLAGQVEPIDHAFLEQCVEVGGVVTGIAGDLVFPRVVPIGGTQEEDGGRRPIFGAWLQRETDVVELGKRRTGHIIGPGVPQREVTTRNGDAVLGQLLGRDGLVERVGNLDGHHGGAIACAIHVTHAFLVEGIQRLDR